MKNKLFTILLLGIFLINFSSALEFDNYGKFIEDDDYGKYEVENFFGLGNKILDIELIENTNTCVDKCSATKEIKLYENTSLVSDVRFYKIENNKKVEVEHNFKYRKLGQKFWKDYEVGKIVEKGNYELYLTGEKNPEEIIDWQILTNGIWTTEWAVWGVAGDISTGLISHYVFNNANHTTLNDTIGSNDGTFSGYTFNDGAVTGATLNTTDGKYGNAYDFDGVNDYIDCGNDSSLDITDEITISAWIKTSTEPQTIIVDKTYTTGFSFFMNGGVGGNLDFWTNNSKLSCDGYLVNDGNWHYVVATFENGNRHIYIDGDDKISDSGTTLGINTDNMFIGSDGGTGAFFNGSIDEVRIWNKALNQTEIQAEMNSSNPVKGDGLVSSWSFEQNNATHTMDTNNLVEGIIEEGGRFDGVNDVINMASPIPSNTPSEMTACAWVNPNTYNGVKFQGIFGYYNDWAMDRRITNYRASINGTWLTGPSVDENVWQLLCMTYNGSKIRIFKNGVLHGTDADYTGNVPANNNFQIGRQAVHATRYFNGSIDEVRIYNKSLTEDEISLLYNTGGGTEYTSSGHITLNSPIDDYIVLENPQEFSCSANITGGATLVNMSLWTNETGNWEVRNTSNQSGFFSWYDNFNEPSVSTALWIENTSGSGTYTADISQSSGIINISSSQSFGVYNYGRAKLTSKYEGMFSKLNFDLSDIGVSGGSQAFGVVYMKISGTTIIGRNHLGSDSWFTSGSNYEIRKEDNTIVGVYKDGLWQKNVTTDLSSPINITFESYSSAANLGQSSSSFLKIDNLTFNDGSNFLFNRTLTSPTLWSCQACDSDGDCGFAAENRTVFLDTNAPSISVESPTNLLDYGAIGNQETLNVTFNDTNLDSCWYNYNGTNISIDGCLTGVKNSTTFTLEKDNYNMTIYTNDSAGNKNSSFIEWSYKVLENNRTHNTTSYETARETYSINLTANSSLTAVTLDYNGTEYSATQSGNIWSYSMDIPTANLGNNSIYWKFTYGDTINSYTSYQNISETIFTLCNATYSDDYLNVTFKDEADLAVLNASVTTSTFEYYLGSGTVTKTYNLINNTDNFNYLFCATPNKTLHVNPYVQYKRNADYPQRIWDAAVQDYTSSLTTQILYLLESADGIYVTIQVINSANQLISGVDIAATREIGGVDTVVAFGTTGDAGTVTFWLNPDFLHVFDLSKTGYTDYQTSLIPTQTSYTITMGGATETENSTIQGISYSTLPTNSYLENDTDYTFGFTLNSSYWDVSDYGFDLRLSNGTIITGDNTGIEGTALTKLYNVNNQSIIYLDYYWVINDVYTNSSTYWIIQNTENTQWSIAVFFEDLTAYIDSGIYGLDNFGKNLIIFLILFISVGIMSYKYGAASPLAVSSMMFGIIFFFDIVVGLIPAIRGAEHLLTYLSALILVLSIFNEVRT